jgi:hypothetical protein
MDGRQGQWGMDMCTPHLGRWVERVTENFLKFESIMVGRLLLLG